jgi:hypothetical protein
MLKTRLVALFDTLVDCDCVEVFCGCEACCGFLVTGCAVEARFGCAAACFIVAGEGGCSAAVVAPSRCGCVRFR